MGGREGKEGARKRKFPWSMHEVGVGASAILCTHVQPPPKPVTHSRRAHACTLAYTGRDKACTLDEPWIRTCVRACATNAPCAPGSHAMHHRCYRPTIFRIFTFTQSSSSFSFFTVSRLLIYISFFPILSDNRAAMDN